MSRTATCVRGACYQSEGAWRDPRAGGGARLALAGAAIACGARVRACGAFRKLLLDGGGCRPPSSFNDIGWEAVSWLMVVLRSHSGPSFVSRVRVMLERSERRGHVGLVGPDVAHQDQVLVGIEESGVLPLARGVEVVLEHLLDPLSVVLEDGPLPGSPDRCRWGYALHVGVLAHSVAAGVGPSDCLDLEMSSATIDHMSRLCPGARLFPPSFRAISSK